MAMPKSSLRGRILDAGLRVMFRKGYIGTSVRDVMADARAPQGSFTNHFRSKEAFTGAVLELYFAHVGNLVHQALGDPTLGPRDRLRRYLDLITERLAADEYARGCLIGDLSLEAAPQSDSLRAQLATIYDTWRRPFAACIAEAQAAGEIATTFPPGELAEFLLASWEGAILRMKVDRSPVALERFKTIAFRTVFTDGSVNTSSDDVP